MRPRSKRSRDAAKHTNSPHCPMARPRRRRSPPIPRGFKDDVLPASQFGSTSEQLSFLVKRNGVQFSREFRNRPLNTYKSSVLCNDKAIDINLDEDGKIVMALKASKRATKPAKSLNKTPARISASKAIQPQTAAPYRGDLTGKARALRGFAPLHEGPAWPGEEGEDEDGHALLETTTRTPSLCAMCNTALF